jgi:uncharacterized protein (DUF1800 family)
VRQPVEMVVHAGRVLNVGLDDDRITLPLVDMGQELFHPANVGGWPHGERWFSPAATLGRYAAAQRLAEMFMSAPFAPIPAADDTAAWAALLGLASISAPTREAVRGFLLSPAAKAGNESERQLGVLLLLLTSPDWAVI